MKRRSLDFVFSIGGLLLAVLLLVLGLVLKANANFAEDYVADQLSQQQITFTPEENLKEDERQSECLVKYAGQLMTTGKQAECYANDYIALHTANAATAAGYEGYTYATLGGPQSELRTELAAATEAGEPTEEIQAQLDKINGLRETMFKGETLRGLLLTSYGFSVFGEKAALAANVCFLVALVLLLASLAGFWHAARTPKDETVLT